MGDVTLRTISVVTVARSDYGIYLPILRVIERDPTLQLRLIVGGMHLAPEYGRTIDAIERDGFAVDDRVEMLLSSDTALGTAKSIGIGVMSFAEAYERTRPEILLVLGDRFEMHAAALASLPFGIPVAHIHGGEVTEGAIDDALRHGITKIAHIHFASTQQHADRLIRMGEEPWRVLVSGAPALDNLATLRFLNPAELTRDFGIPFDPAPLLVTYHPVTRTPEKTVRQIDTLLTALERIAMPILFTMPNADTGGRYFAERVRSFVASHDNAHLLCNLGTQGYFSAMGSAAAMVGNSSSGIIEAASLSLPVVDIGLRQAGRLRPQNVLHVEDDESADAIIEAIVAATKIDFRERIKGLANPYGRGNAAETIVSRLRDVSIDARLLVKKFHDD